MAAAVIFLIGGPTVGYAQSADQRVNQGDPAFQEYQTALERITAGIEGLKSDYPQLSDFTAETHYEPARLVIRYGYKTHKAPGGGGWTSGVPHPDDEGVWFYIDIHDPASTAQVHRQPIVQRYRFLDQEVMFLMLEGRKTESLHGAIVQIFVRNGVEPIAFGE